MNNEQRPAAFFNAIADCWHPQKTPVAGCDGTYRHDGGNRRERLVAFTTIPWNVIGFRVMGDVGGFTIYTDRHFRKVVYDKAPPDKPASPAQRITRDRFRSAVQAWKALTPDEKASLERAVHTASLCLTGQNLYTSCALKHADAVYQTIARQTGETLPTLPAIA